MVIHFCKRLIICKDEKLTAEHSQITLTPVRIDKIFCSTTSGINRPKYPTKATAIAALVHQIEIQYPHPTIKAAKSPNTFWV